MVYHGISYNLQINLSSQFLLPQFLLGLNETPLQNAEVVEVVFLLLPNPGNLFRKPAMGLAPFMETTWSTNWGPGAPGEF